MKKYLIGLIILGMFFTLVSQVKAISLLDLIPDDTPWTYPQAHSRVVLSEQRPKIGSTINFEFQIGNGKNSSPAGSFKVYYLSGYKEKSRKLDCVYWDMSGAKLLFEASIPALKANESYKGTGSFVVDSKYFEVYDSTRDNMIINNNVIFEFDNPNLLCPYSNNILRVDEKSNDYGDISLNLVSIKPEVIKKNTPISVTFKVKNIGFKDFIFPEFSPLRICLNDVNGGIFPDISVMCTTIDNSLKVNEEVTKTINFSSNNFLLKEGTNKTYLGVQSPTRFPQLSYNNDNVWAKITMTGENINNVEPAKPVVSEPIKPVVKDDVTLTNGTVFKSPLHTCVYYYENGTRRPFVNSAVYYTWFSNFKDVKNLKVEQVEEIKLGNPMPIKAGTKLLKFPLNPKVYEVTEGNTIKHIQDETAAKTKFGSNWNKNVIELPEIYYLFYQEIN